MFEQLEMTCSRGTKAVISLTILYKMVKAETKYGLDFTSDTNNTHLWPERGIMWFNKVIALNKPCFWRVRVTFRINYIYAGKGSRCHIKKTEEWRTWSQTFSTSHSDWGNIRGTVEVAHTAHQILKYFSIFCNILYKQDVCTCAVYLIHGGKVDPHAPWPLIG